MTLPARFEPSITIPGPRLLRRVAFRFIRARARKGGAIRGIDAALVPFCDALLCIVLFLLMLFQAPGACPHQAQVPSAVNVRDNVEAPLVAVNRQQVLLDGVPVAETATLEGTGQVILIEQLRSMLRAKRERWHELSPGARFPGVVVLEIDRRVHALSVKCVFQTAARAGYPNVGFLVRQKS